MAAFAAPGPREVFVLGAGFSRAISSSMPVTDKLGQTLQKDYPEVFGSIGSRSFETWLSQRAEAQPYLSTAGNLQNQAVFTAATRLIARVLDWCIAETLAEPMPKWFGELITLWHLRQSDVLTFNYDPLVECAFESLQFWDWRLDKFFSWGSLLNYNPPGMAGSTLGEFGGDAAPHPSFRLWKLHGSTNWFWSPGDTSGASALRVALPGVFETPERVNEQDEHWKAPGRERLIVPPSALKSPYYANPVTRETWARGYEALSGAQTVTLMGYSLPTTDLTTVGMLSEALETGLATELRVVDRTPEPIVGRLRSLVPDHVNVIGVDGADDAVERYVNGMVSAAARSATAEIRDRKGDAANLHMTVTWGDLQQVHRGRRVEDWGRTAAIIGVEPSSEGAEVMLVASELTSFDGAVNIRPVGQPPHLSLRELMVYLADAPTIKVRVPGVEVPVTIVSSTDRRADHGAGNGNWIQLVPAGRLDRDR